MSGNQTLDDSATSVRAGGRPLSDVCSKIQIIMNSS